MTTVTGPTEQTKIISVRNFCKGLYRGKAKSGGDERREASCACGFVNLREKFMKFRESVPNCVNCRGQQKFSPVGTVRGNITLLTDFDQF